MAEGTWRRCFSLIEIARDGKAHALYCNFSEPCAQIFWNAFLSTLAHTGVDAPLLDTDEVRDALQQAADALPEPLHVQVPF